MEPKYDEDYELIATMDDISPPTSNFEPISTDKLLQKQLNGQFCVETSPRLNKGRG